MQRAIIYLYVIRAFRLILYVCVFATGFFSANSSWLLGRLFWFCKSFPMPTNKREFWSRSGIILFDICSPLKDKNILLILCGMLGCVRSHYWLTVYLYLGFTLDRINYYVQYRRKLALDRFLSNVRDVLIWFFIDRRR